jgi:hypothetical protein
VRNERSHLDDIRTSGDLSPDGFGTLNLAVGHFRAVNTVDTLLVRTNHALRACILVRSLLQARSPILAVSSGGYDGAVGAEVSWAGDERVRARKTLAEGNISVLGTFGPEIPNGDEVFGA